MCLSGQVVGCKPIYGGSSPSVPSMKMHEWTTNQWLQWIYSDKDGSDNLIVKMDNWAYPRLSSIITEVDNYTGTYWTFNCPLWLDAINIFSTYNRLFTVLKISVSPNRVRVRIDDIDDGDNVYAIVCKNLQEASSIANTVYEEFAKGKTILACELILDFLIEQGFKRD